ncbi:MAG: hypothetical protein QM756_07635 [Polyangiaceae bacterium]
MMEAAFPLLGTVFVILFVLPCCALLAKAVLIVLERDQSIGPLRALNLRYVLLTGSSALPLAWFLSAGLHQAETWKSGLPCLLDHDAAALCFEPGYFTLALSLAVIGLSVRAVRRQPRAEAALPSDAAAALALRLDGIIARHASLSELHRRVVVCDEEGYTLGTHGLRKPRVFVGIAFASRLSDDMLASALGHEREHVRALDPLRYLLLRVALAVNPFGAMLLDRHVARWHAAREAHCDRQAVVEGAAPLSLADAIVRAARPHCREVVALGAPDTAVLKLRVGLLLAFAEKTPVRCCHEGLAAFPVGFVLLFIALLLPHQAGTGALDALHSGAEHALTYFWR